jgi:hypothetical protein
MTCNPITNACESGCNILLSNTTSEWSNLSNCTNNKINQSRYKIQYDANNCGTYINQTIYEYQTIDCISCGDGLCDSLNGENQTNCPIDCAAGGPVCGNTYCEPSESCSTCPGDCGSCGNENNNGGGSGGGGGGTVTPKVKVTNKTGNNNGGNNISSNQAIGRNETQTPTPEIPEKPVNFFMKNILAILIIAILIIVIVVVLSLYLLKKNKLPKKENIYEKTNQQ